MYYWGSSDRLRGSLCVFLGRVLDQIRHIHWALQRDCKTMQIQAEKHWAIGKLEYRILWSVSKHFLSIKTRTN